MLLLIFPIIGVILSNFFGLNILYSYIINRTNLTKEYNEILFTIIFFNSFNWILYSVMVDDIFLYFSTLFQLISSFGFIQILYKYMDISKLIYIEIISIIYIIYFFIIIFLIHFIPNIPSNIFINITGYTAMITCISTYFSPLLIMKKVIVTKDNTLIYLPQAIIGSINLTCWLVYSIIINDIFQIITDILGLSMCLFQIIIYFIFSI